MPGHDVPAFGANPPNLLLIGPGAAAEQFLVPLMPSLAAPIGYLDAAKPALPTTPVGSLIVRNVARLTPPHQDQFLEWLNAHTETAVIAVTARSLFPRVRRGAFLDALYYRLNTITVELNRRQPTRGQSAIRPSTQKPTASVAQPTPTPRMAPPCPSCDAPGAQWLAFDRADGAFQCVECHCLWTPASHRPSA